MWPLNLWESGWMLLDGEMQSLLLELHHLVSLVLWGQDMPTRCWLCVVFVCACARLFWLCLFFVMGYVFQFGKTAHKRVHYYYWAQWGPSQGMPMDNLGMMKKEKVSSTLDGGWYMSSICWPSLISSTLDEMYGYQTEDLARAHHFVMLRLPSWRRLRTSGLEHLAVHRHLLKGRRSSTMVRCSWFRSSTMVRCSQYCLR